VARAPIERCAIVLLTTVCATFCAEAVDLPSTRGPPQPAVETSCFTSLWSWLNASISSCPLTYAGFTVYGTLDVGYGYDMAGVGFAKWYDKGVFYTIQKTA
jgi:hypothetical protein